MAPIELRTVQFDVKGLEIGFPLVQRISEQLASEVIDEPMLIAWFDGKSGEEHPVVPECQHKPGWLAYAEGHGGCLRVDVNETQYSLIFAEARI